MASKPRNLLKRISIDPRVCGGMPRIRGHRISVSTILDRLAGGDSPEMVLEDFPGLTTADIRACIAYGAEAARGRLLDFPVGRG